MKINEIDKLLLLSQSGELSARNRKRLELMLAADPSARKKAEELDNLRDVWQQATADTPFPSPSVLQGIRQAAAVEARKRDMPALIWFRLPAVGFAAALIALGASLTLTLWSPNAAPPTRVVVVDPVDLQIEAALEAIDTSMLALLDVPTDDALPGNDS